MATLHISEADLVRDLPAVLVKVRQGVEVVIERDQRPVAVLKAPVPIRGGRLISEVVADLKARGSTALMDDDFARDIEDGIQVTRQPWTPPSWD